MTSINQNFFCQPYEREDFLNFLKSDFLPEDVVFAEEDFKDEKYKTIEKAYQIGQVASLDLSLLEIKHKRTEKSRIEIAKDAFKIMADHGIYRALIIFNNDTENYRFSLLTIDVDENDGKVVYASSNPRRYSFFLGKDSKVRTPAQQLLLKGRIKDFADLQSRFSVEPVTREFYTQIQKAFFALVGAESKKNKKSILTENVLKLPNINPQKNHKAYQDFAVRLLGRIIFAWFLKQKKLKNGKSLIADSILSLEAVKSNKNYYHAILEPLFFETFNKEKTERDSSLFPKKLWEDFEKIPFLNGGLFEDHDEDFYQKDATAKLSHAHAPQIPDDWFVGLFEVLEQYNFTIDENSRMEVEISIDPEILGRIFENLLAEINPETGESARKSSGSFYTPREIVDYMVEQSLLEYLKGKFPEDKRQYLSKEKFLALSEQSTEEVQEFLTAHPSQKICHQLKAPLIDSYQEVLLSPHLFLKFRGVNKTTEHFEITPEFWEHFLSNQFEISGAFFGRSKEVYLYDSVQRKKQKRHYPSIQMFFNCRDKDFVAFLTPLYSGKMILNTVFQINAQRKRAYEKKFPTLLEKIESFFGIKKKSSREDADSLHRAHPPKADSRTQLSDKFSDSLRELFSSSHIVEDELLRVKFEGHNSALWDEIEKIVTGTQDETEQETTEKILKALDDLKILDPACGSGAFPMGILQKIVHILERLDPENEIYLDQVVNQNPPELREMVRKHLEQKNLNYVRKLGIIQKSIFGVDIQEMAVEISRLRFFLSLVVDENSENIEPLPNLDFKFVCANSLIPLPDISAGAQPELFADTKREEVLMKMKKVKEDYFQARGDKKWKLRYQFAEYQKELLNLTIDNAGVGHGDSAVAQYAFKIQHWKPFENHSASFFDSEWMFGVKDGFDIVIGNPPYLRIQGLQKTQPEMISLYRENYNSASGSFDLYALFIEQGCQFLSKSGQLVYIVPHKFFQASFGVNLRQMITEKQLLNQIVRFGAEQVFDNPTTYTCLLFLSMQQKKDFEFIEISSLKNLTDTMDGISSKKELKNVKRARLDFPEATEWNFQLGNVGKILEKIKKQPQKLGDVVEKIFQGIATSADNIYVLKKIEEKEKTILLFSNSLQKEVEIEKGFLRPFLMGKDVHRYEQTLPKNYVIFPYKVSAKAELMTAEFIQENFPLGWNYVMENKEGLENRERGRMKCDDFYAYIYPKNLTLYHLPKIMTPDIARGCQMIVDQIGLAHTTTLYSFVFKEDEKENMQYWLGLLNSKILWFFLVNTGSVLRGNFFRFKTNYLKPFPIPQITPANHPLATQIESLVDQILTAKKENPKADTSALEKEIDDLVFELYGLEGEEKEIVRNS